MSRALQLTIVVGEAAFIAFAGSIALVLVAVLLGLNPEQKSVAVELAFLMAILLPITAAVRWLFRKLRNTYERREARAVSIAFGVFTPISLAVSMVLGEVSAGYAESLGGRRFFGAIGAFAGALMMTVFLTLFVCALVLRVTKLTIDVEKNDSSTTPD
jgi:MFS family permease